MWGLCRIEFALPCLPPPRVTTNCFAPIPLTTKLIHFLVKYDFFTGARVPLLDHPCSFYFLA